MKLDVTVDAFRSGNGSRFELVKNPLLKELRGFVNTGIEYLLLKTTANPEAVKLIAENDKMLTQARKMDTSEFNTYFDMSLMDRYLTALSQLVKEEMGCVSYPYVNVDVHNSERRQEQIHWPVLHIPQSPQRFKSIATHLNSKDAFAVLEKNEAPQNYLLPVIELLRRKSVEPLQVEEFVSIPGGALLLGAELFLRPVYTCTHTPSYSED